jgi:hypothetical protein
LDEKQTLISPTNTITIPDVGLLQDALNAKQATITTDSLAISDVALLQGTLNAKQDALTTSSALSIDSLTANSIETSSVRAPPGVALKLANELGFGLLVASNGFIGVLKDAPQEALDVSGTIACTNLAASSAVTAGGINLLTALDAKANDSTVTTLQTEVSGKSPLLSSLAGTGTEFVFDSANGVLRKIYGNDGIVVDQSINLEDPNDPDNFQIRISGTSILTSLATKQDTLYTLDGTGIPLLFSPTELRRIFGSDGISVTSPLNADTSDPTNFQIEVSG